MNNRPTGTTWRFRATDGNRVIQAQDDGVFDELVVDQWLHIEHMEAGTWWIRVGDASIVVSVRDDGSSEVSIERGVY